MLPYSFSSLFFSFAFYCNWFPQTCGFWVFSSCLNNYISPSQSSQYIKFAAHKIFIQHCLNLSGFSNVRSSHLLHVLPPSKAFEEFGWVLWEKTVFPDLNFFLIKRVMYRTIRKLTISTFTTLKEYWDEKRKRYSTGWEEKHLIFGW